jgi:phage gp46-like protein
MRKREMVIQLVIADEEGEHTCRNEMLLVNYILKVDAILSIFSSRCASNAKGAVRIGDRDFWGRSRGKGS